MATKKNEIEPGSFDDLEGLARFPEESISPVFRIHKSGRTLFANKFTRETPVLYNAKTKKFGPEIVQRAKECFESRKRSAMDIEINGALVTGDFVGFGGLRYLGTAADGSVVIKREDVLQTDPVFRVLSTVEWYSAAGEFLGSSRVPSLETQAIDQVPGVAVARDGSVYALIARDDRVEIIELERHSRRIMEFAGTT